MSTTALKLLSGLAIVASLTTTATAQTKVNIAHVLGSDFLPVFVAKETNCFAGKGLDATLTMTPILSNIPATLIAGSTQIGITTAPVMMQAVENGLDLISIAGSSRMPASAPTMTVVVRTDVKAATAADLKGKKVAVPGINSLGDIVFRKWLKNNGVGAGEVSVVEAPIPQMPDLLKGGTVDAVVIMEPLRSRIVAAGTGYRHPQEYYAATAPDSMATMWIATGAWAKANAAGVKAFRECVAESIVFIKTKPDEAKKVELKYLNYNAPLYPVFESVVKPVDFKIHADMATEAGLLKKPVDLNALVAP